MFAWCSVCIISHKVIRKTKCNRQEERKITKEENAPFCHELCKKKKIKNQKYESANFRSTTGTLQFLTIQRIAMINVQNNFTLSKALSK